MKAKPRSYVVFRISQAINELKTSKDVIDYTLKNNSKLESDDLYNLTTLAYDIGIELEKLKNLKTEARKKLGLD